MTFGNPIGLIGLVSLPAILALHLLFKRQRRYVVSHLGLWAFIHSELHGPRSRRIPITWILALDLLIAALLSLAWAQPRIDLGWLDNRPRHYVILLDVSSSMRAVDPGAAGRTARFEQAQAAARALLEGAGPRDVVTMLTFGRQARLAADSRAGQGGLVALIEQINQSQAGETGSGALREALALGQAALEPSLRAEFHIMTDGGFPLDSLVELEQLPQNLQWHFVGQPVENQAVIDLNAVPLGEDSYQVFARIANFSDVPANREVVLEVDGRPTEQAEVVLPAGTSIARVWQIAVDPAQGTTQVRVALDGSDSLVEDDVAMIGLWPGGGARVALVVEDPAVGDAEAHPSTAIRRAVQAVPGVEMNLFSAEAFAALQAGERSGWDLTIYQNTLPSSWPEGHTLVVDPPVERAGDVGIDLYALARIAVPAGTPVRAPNPSPTIDGIDFSGVRWSSAWSLGSLPPGFIPLLAVGEVPLLVQGPSHPSSPGGGRVVVLTADLARGNLTRHPAFPILIANLVEGARRPPLPPGFQTGETVPLPAAGAGDSLQVIPPQQPDARFRAPWPPTWSDTLEPGLYRFRIVQSDGEVVEFAAGARMGDAQESDLRVQSAARLVSEGAPAAVEDMLEEERLVDLQGWLLSAALLLLLVETVLAWRR